MVRYVNVFDTGTITIDNDESGSNTTVAINGTLSRIAIIEDSVAPGGGTGSYNLIVSESGTAFPIYANDNLTATTNANLIPMGSEFLLNGPIVASLANAGTGATLSLKYYVR